MQLFTIVGGFYADGLSLSAQANHFSGAIVIPADGPGFGNTVDSRGTAKLDINEFADTSLVFEQVYPALVRFCTLSKQETDIWTGTYLGEGLKPGNIVCRIFETQISPGNVRLKFK